MQFLRRILAATLPERAASSRVQGRPGYDASHDRTLERVRPMLVAEPVVWLSTVRPDGLPHLVPTWFWWDGEAMLVFSKPDAVKVRNLRANPRLMVALGRPESDFSVGLIEAEASSSPVPPRSRTRSSPSTPRCWPTAGSTGDLPRHLHAGHPDRPDPLRLVARTRCRARGPGPAERPSLSDAPALSFRGTMLPAWA